MEEAYVDPTLGEDIVTLSQCGPLFFLKFSLKLRSTTLCITERT
jgi:hypothetical protein